MQRSVCICLVIIRDSLDVAHLHLRFGGERNATENTWQTEHILALKERAVAMTVNLNSHYVAALLIKIRCDVKLSKVARVLCKTYILAVDVEIEERVYTVEVDVYLLALPIGRHVKRAAVRADLVTVLVCHPVLVGCAHHATLPVAHLYAVLEDDTLVGIQRHSILECAVVLGTSHVPVHRNLHTVPSRCVKIGTIEVFRTFVGILCPVEQPLSVESLPER